MPLGMTSQVIGPTAATSPVWMQHLVNAGRRSGATTRSPPPASAVWIQVGLGIWLIVAPRGYWSRLAGLAAGFWESSSGSSARASAGSLLRRSRGPSGPLGRLSSTAWPGCSSPCRRECGRARDSAGRSFGHGSLLRRNGSPSGLAGPGFWQGQVGHSVVPGTLTGMVQEMSATPQPAFISSWLAGFAAFDAAHGWAVNLFLVICLAAIGSVF